jgi:hypothetical protein
MVINDKVLKTFSLYGRLICLNRVRFALSVIVGFALRVVSVASFLLSIKVFLALIGFDKFYDAIVLSFGESLPADLTRDTYNQILIAILVSSVVLQFILSKIYSPLVSLTTKDIALRYSYKANLDLRCVRSFTVMWLQTGIEQSIKVFEIALFYILLLSVIFLIDLKMLFALLVFTTLIVVYLVYTKKTEVRLSEVLSDVRSSGRENKESVIAAINANADNTSRQLNSALTPRTLSSVAIVSMICLYFMLANKETLDSLFAIVLIFSMRFVVIYTGELSRAISSLTRQRITVSKHYQDLLIGF